MSQRIVIVGGGMVGARFAGDLVDALGRTDARAQITLIGDEPYAPYNRVLLSEVIAGRTALAALELPPVPKQVRELRGVTVAQIERRNRIVRTAEGEQVPYDVLVLATGARARLPQIPGLRAGDGPGHGVRVLRSLDDARGLLAVAAVPGRIAVLGGGVLGVEVAAGLHERGAHVSLVHSGAGPMERQLDPESAAVLAATMTDRGIRVVADADVIAFARAEGRLRGLVLADGRTVAADTVVVTAGTEPEVQLARDAGLPVDRGILTGADLRCIEDRAIAAIGDCAQPPTGISGLIGPGWEQARRLARQIAGEPAADWNGQRDTVRLKAGTINALTLGDRRLLDESSPLRVLSLRDDNGRRSIRIATDGRTLHAAVCVGAPRIAAELQVYFERELRVPTDPTHLMIDRALVAPPSGDVSISKIPDTAALCRCNGVTKGQVIGAYRAGDRTVTEVAERTRATTGCGGCTDAVNDVLIWLNQADPDPSGSTPPAAAIADDAGSSTPVSAVPGQP